VSDEEQRLAAIDRNLAACGLRIKTHGYRWTIALAYATLHSARTGHGADWRIELHEGNRVRMHCPGCDADVLISTERTHD